MVETVLRQSPLSTCHPEVGALAEIGEAGAALRERPYRTKVNLRGDAADKAFLKAVAGATGIELPLEPNRTAVIERQFGPVATLWLGPNEWLFTGAPDQAAALVEALDGALIGRHAAVNDLSGSRTTIELSGPRHLDLLAKGCALDLDLAAFPVGACAQTHIARALVILHRTAEDRVEIHVARSFAEYLWLWLLDAGAEYGVVTLAGAP
ncbi:sarcosine oxidase subunit gamma [Oceanibacterium hippocampi]|uniref:Sarcosine oxidase, gamma subunit family n=1 Tax=Oceanibacterium hippocampi TaxID=745714 RepID=A0A1Y5SRB5_9PROT|nr:sarcosine oxidase subunit gamma family protein [Oceanibacterium hippocampi]SLN43500.1 Sarcosine oxidase, gamma subunit family [Oceanibacterium hippocampi]